MGKFFQKDLIPIGTFYSPQGKVEVTPQRVRRWVQKFNELKRRGVHFPIPWGHQLTAIPQELDQEQFQLALSRRVAEEAKFNAGFISELFENPVNGALAMRAEVPPGYEIDESGDIINRMLGTRIREVSAGIAPFWVDGSGQKHRDIIAHAALVPLPVVMGQNGFTALSTAPTCGRIIYLSTDPKGVFMAKDEEMDELDTPTEEVDEDVIEDDSDDMPELEDEIEIHDEPDGDEVVTEEEDVLAPYPEPSNEHFNQLMAVLGEMGITLLEGTTPQNLVERLLQAMLQSRAQGMKLTKPEAVPTTSPDQDMPDMSSAVVDNAAPTTMLSTGGVTLPSQALLVAKRGAKKKRLQLAKLVDELVTLGVPSSVVGKVKAQCPTVNLSLNPATMVFKKSPLEEKIRFAIQCVKAIRPGAAKDLLTTLSTTANPLPNPLTPQQTDDKPSDLLTDIVRDMFGANAIPGKVD